MNGYFHVLCLLLVRLNKRAASTTTVLSLDHGDGRQSSFFRIPLLIFVASALSSAACAETPTLTPLPTSSAFKDFKRFLSTPPTIERVVFREKRMPGNVHPSRTNGLERSRQSQIYVGSWQTNAWTMRAVGTSIESPKVRITALSASVFGSEQWIMNKDGMVQYWFATDSPVLPNAERNFVAPSTFALGYHLSELLTMGLYGLPVGSLRWNADSFSTTNVELGFQVEGSLSQSKDGFASTLSVRYYNETSSHQYIVQYFYTNDTGISYIPSNIRRIELVDGKTIERYVADVISIRLLDGSAPRGSFSPSQDLFAYPIDLRIYTNGAYYRTDANQKLVRAPLHSDPSTNPADRARPVYLAATALLSGIVLMFLVKLQNTKHTRAFDALREQEQQ